MSGGVHSVAEAVARSRRLDLEPDRGESSAAFASRVLEEISEQLVDHVSGRLTDRAEALFYGQAPHRDGRSLRWAVTDLQALMGDVSTLLTVIPDEEM